MADALAPVAGQPGSSSPLGLQTAARDSSEEVASVFPSVDGGRVMNRSASTASSKFDASSQSVLSRAGTLKKKGSVKRGTSLRRASSKRSLRAGSMKYLGGGTDDPDFNSVFYTPIPTSGNPTDILANRFQVWRKLLKDLITYFREIQSSYEHRSKALVKVSNVINNTTTPPLFLTEGGIDEATAILRSFHKVSLAETNKSKDILNDVVVQLSGLRSDLNQKIKEIKSLSGDFKNSVDKEKEGTKKAVTALQDAIHGAENELASAAGKGDPFIVRLGVDRQVEKQIEEENYLHRAYLNLEGSGRELESIVIGEIQKAYNAYSGILKRETESSQTTVEDLRAGPIAMPKDREWQSFVETDPHFIDPSIPVRKLDHIHYPGQDSPLATEIRGGRLERKSKYLKSYTAGWYVLSPTHLHEFKSPDHIQTQTPVMSLYLPDQRLGSHSSDSGSSHKFSLKGRQTGAMHRGHAWVFRAESYDTMLAWYEDIKILTENSGEEKTALLRRHARSVSGGQAPSVSSDGIDEDEADQVPYAAGEALPAVAALEARPQRPEPGGRFPSDIDVNRGLQAPVSPSSGGSYERDLADEAFVPVGQDLSSSNPVSTLSQSHELPSAHTPPLSSALNAAGASNQGHGNGDVLAAVAGGSALAGGALGATGATMASRHKHREDDDNSTINTVLPAAETPTPATITAAPRDGNTNGYFEQPNGTTSSTLPPSLVAGRPAPRTAGSTADSTASIAPPDLSRQTTDVSVSQLHVPGEFPPTPKELPTPQG